MPVTRRQTAGSQESFSDHFTSRRRPAAKRIVLESTMPSSPIDVGLSAPDLSSQPDRTGCIQTDRLTIVHA